VVTTLTPGQSAGIERYRALVLLGELRRLQEQQHAVASDPKSCRKGCRLSVDIPPAPTHRPDRHILFIPALPRALGFRWGVQRFVNISSESAVGFFFPERPFLPSYLPIDEDHPLLPQDPYALSKVFGEQLMDAALRRSDINIITIRPSSVVWEGNAEVSLGPLLRDPAANQTPNVHSYIDVYDLADAILAAAESDLPGHEVIYIASPDNVGNHDFTDLLRNVYGLIRDFVHQGSAPAEIQSAAVVE
jgi:hypothetical protein